MIVKTASMYVPLSKVSKRKDVPWWNNECSKALKERNQAFKMVRKNLNQENVNQQRNAWR